MTVTVSVPLSTSAFINGTTASTGDDIDADALAAACVKLATSLGVWLMFIAAGIEILCIRYCPETRAKIRRHLCCCCCCGCKRSTRRRPPPNSAKREDPEDPPDEEHVNRKGTVLLFNSMLTDRPNEARKLQPDTADVYRGGACINDVRPQFVKESRQGDTVIPHVGSNDLPGRLEADGMAADYRGPLQEARAFSNNAVAPSVCPRTVSDHVDLMPKLDSVSVGGLDLATGKDFVFIDYDSYFHTRDGGINDAALCGDGLHLSKYRTNKLVSPLELKTTDVDITKSNRLSAPTRVSRPTRRQEERPSNHMHQHDRRNRSTLADRTENARDSTSAVHSACYKCGLYDHTTDGCRHRFRVKCKKCGQLGHKSYSTMCQWSESDS